LQQSDLSVKTKTHFAFRVDIWELAIESVIVFLRR
jgi:hypothetical protein